MGCARVPSFILSVETTIHLLNNVTYFFVLSALLKTMDKICFRFPAGLLNSFTVM
jgi:hypothetical protein